MQKKFQSCQQKKQVPSQSQLKSFLPAVNQVIVNKSIFTEGQVIMILQDSYIILHHKGQLFMIDQHAACQKILYMQNYEKLKKQKSSMPIVNKTIYSIPCLYINILKQNQNLINHLGWSYKMGQTKNSFIQLRIIKQPQIFQDRLGQNQFLYYLQQIYDNQCTKVQEVILKVDLSQKQKQILAQYACHKAYRFGQKIPLNKAQQIIRKLGHIQAPFNCPHSRVLISYYGNVKQLGLF